MTPQSTGTFTLTSTVRNHPHFPYEKMKRDILGASYQLSLAFVGAKRAQLLNQQYRKKDYVPNVLSFPLSHTIGEIYICPAVAKSEAAKFELSVAGYVAYLFIHGLLHLKGHDHGATMEKLEQRYLRKYSIV